MLLTDRQHTVYALPIYRLWYGDTLKMHGAIALTVQRYTDYRMPIYCLWYDLIAEMEHLKEKMADLMEKMAEEFEQR